MLTQDPIGLAGGVNLYAYAGNNPVAFGDPFGLCPWHDIECWEDKIWAASGGTGFAGKVLAPTASVALDLSGLGPIDAKAKAVAANPTSLTVIGLALGILLEASPLDAGAIARQIGKGHAFFRHVLNKGEFKGLGIRTIRQFQAHIEQVMRRPAEQTSGSYATGVPRTGMMKLGQSSSTTHVMLMLAQPFSPKLDGPISNGRIEAVHICESIKCQRRR